MTPDERTTRLRQQLQALFVRARLPTSPAVAAHILELVDDPSSSAARFAALIETDPALAASLLRMANSARYAQRNQVTTIQRAITVVGLRQLRVLVLGFDLADHLDRIGSCPFDLGRFWQHSVLRACVAQEVARRVVPHRDDEAFLIGLLQECGTILLVQVLGCGYASLCNRSLSPAAFYLQERRSFPFTHVDAIAALAEMWRLPVSIADPLATHHRRVRVGGRSPEAVRLAAVSFFAGSLSFERDAVQTPPEAALLTYARTDLKLGEEELNRCFESAALAYRGVADLFGTHLPPDRDVSGLLAEANRHLLREACDSELRIREVEVERDTILCEQVTLRNALGQYREQAALDPLTGLLNRRAVLDALDAHAAGDHETLTLLFIDIDDFKPINDHHGHQVGDDVLEAVAACVAAAAGEHGAAGRWGGEEFIVVIPDLGAEQARRAAAALVEAVRGIEVAGVHLGRPVTCSLGAVRVELPDERASQVLIRAADELMYRAKRGGKDHGWFADGDCVPEQIAGGAVAAPPSRTRPFADPRPLGASVPVEVFEAAARRLAQQAADREPSMRKQRRHELSQLCTISYLLPSGRIAQEPAFVRSIATGGIGLLSGRPLERGDLIEVSVELGGRTFHLAGLVAFARPVDESVHDIGVQVFHRSEQPILGATGAEAVRSLDWAIDAVDRRGAA